MSLLVPEHIAEAYQWPKTHASRARRGSEIGSTAFVIDLDGVVWVGRTALPGVAEALHPSHSRAPQRSRTQNSWS